MASIVTPALGFDLWLALLAGDRTWQEDSAELSVRDRAVACVMVVALAVVVLVAWLCCSLRVDLVDGASGPERELIAAAIVVTGACLALSLRPIRVATGRRGRQASFVRSVVWRSLMYIVLVASSAGLIVQLRFLGAIPLGLVVGADSLLALRALGLELRPTVWLRRFALSSLHFGFIGAMLAAIVRKPERGGLVLSLYAAMWVGVLVTLATLRTMSELTSLSDVVRDRDRHEIKAQERAYRAHWLHDDVLSEVRLTTLRLDGKPGETLDPGVARQELLELDHRLRLRQLDEIMVGGATYLYEVLQPHLRRAQSLGIELVEVPSIETTGCLIDEASSRRLHRATSIVLSNAINAGATTLSLTLSDVSDATVVLTVTDNAGGFSIEDSAPGRGLASLRRDFGLDSVEVDAVDGGSAVVVRVEVTIVDRASRS